MIIMANLLLTWNLLFFVLLGTQTAAVTGTINPDEPFIVTGTRSPEQYFAIAPLDTLDFTEFEVQGLSTISDFSYDPVEQKLYISSLIAGLIRVNLDGTEDELIIGGGLKGVAVNPNTRKLFTCGPGGVYMSNLDGSNNTRISLYGIGASYERMSRFGSRIYASYIGPHSGLQCFDSSTGDYLPEESYLMTPNAEFIKAPAIDVAGGKLYWCPTNGFARIFRQAIDDLNSTCTQTIFDITESKDPDDSANYYASDIMFHQDYIYMTTEPQKTTGPLSGLLRVHKSGGALEDLGNLDITRGALFGIYIHDPAKNAAEQGFVGGVLKDELKGVNYTTPEEMTFRVTDITKWFGGMIIDLAIPITGPIGNWHLDISFPRRIFKLEIQGCDVEISDVKQRRYGRRQGTDYVIIPGLNNRSPPPGEDLTIRFIVKTWKDVREMKRGITAHFVPVPDIFECDPGPLTTPPTS